MNEARYFRVGLFVFLGALSVLVMAVLFGGGNLFAERVVFETYFDEAVTGLEVGSAVTYCELGDHVILSTFGNCGYCPECEDGEPGNCRTAGLGGLGQRGADHEALACTGQGSCQPYPQAHESYHGHCR